MPRVIEDELLKELDAEIEWRISELCMIKTIPHLYNVSNIHKELLLKYLIPAIYAIWEGFVVYSFELYTKKINNMSLNINQIHHNILTHDLDMSKSLNNGRSDFTKKVKFVLDLKSYFSSNLSITGKIPTKSNVKFKTVNNILMRFNLESLPKKYYEKALNKLLTYRNHIAHGQNSIRVDSNIVCELCDIVVKCMDKISEIMIDGIKNKSYLG